MKNFFKARAALLFGIILTLVIGFSVIACGDDDEDDPAWKAAAKTAYQNAKFAPTFDEIMPSSVKNAAGRAAELATQQDFEQMISIHDGRTQSMSQRKNEVLTAIERLTAAGEWQDFSLSSQTGQAHTVSYRLDINTDGSRSVGVKDSNWNSGGWSAVLSADEKTLEFITDYTRTIQGETITQKYYSSYNGEIFIEMEYELTSSRETVQYAEYKKTAGVYTGEHTRIDKHLPQNAYEFNQNLEKGDNDNYLYLHRYITGSEGETTKYLGSENAFVIDPNNVKLSSIPGLADMVITKSNLPEVFTKINAYLTTKI